MKAIGGILSALSDLGLGLTYLIAWISPSSPLAAWVAPAHAREGMLRYLLLLMLFEFVVVHSASFMGVVAFSGLPGSKKALAILGLGAFYSILPIALALSFGTLWPMWAFWGLTLNRLASAVFGPAPDGKALVLVRYRWALSAGSYLMFVFLTTLLPVPRFGITPATVSAAHLPGSGLWVSEPHRVIAMGTGYFLLQALYELYGLVRPAPDVIGRRA
jgi:hypothetical protein